METDGVAAGRGIIIPRGLVEAVNRQITRINPVRGAEQVARVAEPVRAGEVPVDHIVPPERLDVIFKKHEPYTPGIIFTLGNLKLLREQVMASNSGCDVIKGKREAEFKGNYGDRVAAMNFLELQVEFLQMLNGAIRGNYEKFQLIEVNSLMIIMNKAERMQLLMSEGSAEERTAKMRAEIVVTEMKKWKENTNQLLKFFSEAWEPGIGGGSADLVKILQEASGKGIGNEVLMFLMRDPEIKDACFRLNTGLPLGEFMGRGAGKGGEIQDQTNYEFGPNDQRGDFRVLIKGGDFAGAEKLGYLIRWVTGRAFFDEIQPVTTAAHAYTPYRCRFLNKYLEGKGFYRWIHLVENKMITLTDGVTKKPIKIVHGVNPFPTMWHAPNAMAEFWVDNFQEIGGKESGEVVMVDGKRYVLPSGWQSQARLMSLYKGDFRERAWKAEHHGKKSPYYTLEQFDLESPEVQRELYIRTLLKFREREPDDKQREKQIKIIANNLIRVHSVARVDNKGKAILPVARVDNKGKAILRKDGTPDTAEKPILDLDAVYPVGHELAGKPIIDFAELDTAHFGDLESSNAMNNFYTYEEYAARTLLLHQELARMDPEAHEGRMKLFAEFLNPDKGFRHLYARLEEIVLENMEIIGEVEQADGSKVFKTRKVEYKTHRQIGNLAMREEELDFLFEQFSGQLLVYMWSLRKQGIRTPVGEMVNQYMRFGMYRGFYALEFRSAGLDGKNWNTMYENQLDGHEKIAKLMGKFGNREAWIAFIRHSFAGTDKGRALEEVLGIRFNDKRHKKVMDDKLIRVFTAYAGFRPAYWNKEGEIPVEDGKRMFNPETGEMYKRRVDWGDRGEDDRHVGFLAFDVDEGGAWRNADDGLKGYGIGELEWVQISGIIDATFKDPLYSDFGLADYLEYGDEQKVMGKMVQLLRKTKFDPKNTLGGREWGLKIHKYRGEQYRDRILRETTIYTVGDLRGKWVYDQARTDSVGRVILDDKGVADIAYFSKLSSFQTQHEMGKADDFDLVKIRERSNEFAYSEEEGRERDVGQDIVGSLLLGSAGLPIKSRGDAGMEKRLTRLDNFFDKEILNDLILAVFADGEYVVEWGRNAGLRWWKDSLFARVFSPGTLVLYFNALRDKAGEDADWANNRAKENGGVMTSTEEYSHKQEDLMIQDVKKGVEHKQVEKAGDLTSFISLASDIGIPVKPIGKSPLWRSPAEGYAMLRGALVSGAIWAGAVTAGLLSVSPIIVPVALTFMTYKFIWGARHQGYFNDQLSMGLDNARGVNRMINEMWGMMKARRSAMNEDAVIRGNKPVWDDTWDLANILKYWFEEPKEKYHRVPLRGL